MKLNRVTILSILTTGDKILIAFLVVASFSSIGWLVAASRPGDIALITVGNQVVLRKSLLEPADLEIEGARGTLHVRIAGKAIRIIAADCPRQLCVRQGAIRNQHDIIVCVPNKVAIWILGETQINKFDAVTG